MQMADALSTKKIGSLCSQRALAGGKLVMDGSSFDCGLGCFGAENRAWWESGGNAEV